MNPKRRTLRRFGFCAATAIVVLVSVALLVPGNFLCIEDAASKADVIVVLGGDDGSRCVHAAKLFHEGLAPRIIVSGEGDCEANRQTLIKCGLPSGVIQLECESGNTKQNAEFSVRLMKAQGIKRAIIVSSWYHSRRAVNAFRKYAPEIQFFSRPSHIGDSNLAWIRTPLASQVLKEYPKNVYYWIRYGIAPF
jgi:uncharacterized SAM-binding protein YcdF (DUF218 family)